jgi:hypothetical protein
VTTTVATPDAPVVDTNKVLFAAMTSFLRVFVSSFLVFVTGILSAPNQNAAISLSIAALTASLAAGLRALQVFVPQISFKSLVGQPLAAWLDAFTIGSITAFITAITGWLAENDFTAWKSIVIGIVVGALSSGARAVQGLVTPGDWPAPAKGLAVQAATPAPDTK